MLNATQLQNSYNKLYEYLREYIWPVNVVEQIADLEVSCYKSFPNLIDVRNYYNKLKSSVFRYVEEDEGMETAFEEFKDVLESDSTLYAKLNTRLEGAK